uniref:Uncharacterized protein n=1 Tax=Candidatus Methanogaster sp. ANME-2c ERB4 TaxID=2759911 RepID=A0A7G9YJ40_9EURY|nr:hypothetical protein BOHIEODL_00004 [Methanosarcinales archaeon ANME-2c ERB4]
MRALDHIQSPVIKDNDPTDDRTIHECAVCATDRSERLKIVLNNNL